MIQGRLTGEKKINLFAQRSHRNETLKVTKSGCLYIHFIQIDNYFWQVNKRALLVVADQWRSHTNFFYTAFFYLNFLILLMRIFSVLWVWGEYLHTGDFFLTFGGKRRIRVLFSSKYHFFLIVCQVALTQNNLYAIVCVLGQPALSQETGHININMW